MKFRKLRIAWSVMCGIVCVLLIVLWVRSFTVMDSLLFQYSSTSPCLRINSLHAGTFITFRNYGYGASVWRISHTPIADTFMLEDVNGQKVNTAWFHVWRNNGTSEVYAPYWFPLLLSGAHTAVHSGAGAASTRRLQRGVRPRSNKHDVDRFCVAGPTSLA